MIDIRCPHCNKKAAETPNKNTIIMTVCTRCKCRYKYDNGVYKHESPTDMGSRMKYDKYKNTSYQERMKLNKK